jgi:Ca-activated chloride channel family protein
MAPGRRGLFALSLLALVAGCDPSPKQPAKEAEPGPAKTTEQTPPPVAQPAEKPPVVAEVQPKFEPPRPEGKAEPKPEPAPQLPPSYPGFSVGGFYQPAPDNAAPATTQAPSAAMVLRKQVAPTGSFASPVAHPPHQPPQMMPPQDTAQYEHAEANPVVRTAEQPVSTFSLDVDSASYANVRRFLRQGRTPPRDAVRVEEMVNYFDYDYPAPKDKTEPFQATVTVMPTPWNKDTKLMHVGIRGYDIDRTQRPRLNLVLLLDVSGSMEPTDRLPLLKQALHLLVDQLKDNDTVGIVTYAGRSGVLLEPTRGAQRQKILEAIDSLHAGGSTAGAAGLEAAYRLAQQHFDSEAVNRIILGTDGDFNVGVSDPKVLERVIADKRKTGIYLSIIGVGSDNLNDRLMQTLAQKGNGTAAYMDSLMEARKIFVDNMQALFPIADDVKVQVEFNPAQVAEYRLIGYETRMLKREDFKNDKVDAGEVSAGHTVTAIYEITPPGSKALVYDPLRYQPEKPLPAGGDELAFLRLRYKLPGEPTSKLIEKPVRAAQAVADPTHASSEVRFAVAVAGFGQTLRGDPSIKDWDYGRLLALAQGAKGEDLFGYRSEFVQLVRMMAPPAGR